MRPFLISITLCTCVVLPASAQLPRLSANDNRTKAGTLEQGVLRLELEITQGMWHPDADHSAGIDVIAVGEAGKAASVPGPLIRVPVGTEVRTRLRNTLTEPMLVFGFGTSHSLRDSVRLAAGETRDFVRHANQPGNFMYAVMRAYRTSTPEAPPAGNDLVASGAFIVDAPGVRSKDRVLVINAMSDTVRIQRQPGTVARLLTLNGKSWPHTERMLYDIGDTIIWRVINASLSPHPMHLHGFHFDVLSRGTTADDTTYAASSVRKAVTERMVPFTTMGMRWVPDRPGNWLFHCHLPAHTALHGALGPVKASSHAVHVHDVLQGMSNLMMGTTVRGRANTEPAARRKLQLYVHQHDSIAGELTPRFSYSLTADKSYNQVGPTLLVQQGEPTAITVINRANEPTAVHWHGIELESFNDGAPGYSGQGKRIAPLISSNDSFTARMTPPRAGTFIYHTHADERRQQRGGLYGALLVLPRGKQYDADSERVIVLGTPPDTSQIMINGAANPTIELKAGRTYRLRMIHIMTTRPNMHVTLVNDGGDALQWQLVAKDGADLPRHQVRQTVARQQMSNGETYDVLFTPSQAGDLKFEAYGGPLLLGWARVRVR